MHRYWEIAELLRQDIAAGRYPVGEHLPTEEELIKLLQASRYTVREALRLLTEDGLISRRPRAGSTVIAANPRVHFTQRLASVQELLNYPAITTRKMLSAGFIEADHELAALLKCAVATSWFCFHTLRFAPGSTVPLCETHIYVRPELAGITRHRKHDSIPFADQIAEMYGISAVNAEIEISASLVGHASARLLKVPAASPALTTVRRYAAGDGTVFEVALAVHPAQRYTYNFHLRRERPGSSKRPPGRDT